ncbi:MAG: MFS transporter [Halioglobus sp.]
MTSSERALSGKLTKLTYGFGAMAYGIKDSGFSYFLLMFYSTVVGLDPGIVGLAIFIALVADAVSDPVVGYVSDNWRSRWGRRHPFMYASAIPVAVSYFLLWNPPDWSATALFWYLVALSIVIRTFITLYETPSSSLMPELTRDYVERTSFQAYRVFFGWIGGLSMSLLMFGFLLVATDEYAVGTLNRDGYATYGVVASVMMFLAIMVSALGTHRVIKFLQPPPDQRALGLKAIFAEIFETLRDRSFFALFMSQIFSAVAAGTSAALAFLMLTYFWGFSSSQIFEYLILLLVAAFIGPLLAPIVVRRFGKKGAVVGIGIVAYSLLPLLVVARLTGLLPANDDPWLPVIVLAVYALDIMLLIAMQSINGSMLADLVEQSEVRTGRRSEGIFYAAVTFTRKSTQGFGALIAGVILSVVGFPNGADPASVPAETLWNLGAWYAPTLLLLFSCVLIAVSFYRIDRTSHQSNVDVLAKRKAEAT